MASFSPPAEPVVWPTRLSLYNVVPGRKRRIGCLENLRHVHEPTALCPNVVQFFIKHFATHGDVGQHLIPVLAATIQEALA